MARKRQKSDEPLERPKLLLPREQVEAILDRGVAEGNHLLVDSQSLIAESAVERWGLDRDRWISRTVERLRSAYSTGEPADGFEQATYGTSVIGSARDNLEYDVRYTERAMNELVSLKERLEFVAAADDGPARQLQARRPRADAHVFIVHGRDEERKAQVARVLERAGDHEVVVLHERPNRGRTLIEKFEDYASEADYAVILCTGDDVGALAPDAPEGVPELQPRPRQNVVFELGFFIGRLGRSQVCVLYEEGVEFPGDYRGVTYIPLDAAQAWCYGLVRELKDAGFVYSLDKVP